MPKVSFVKICPWTNPSVGLNQPVFFYINQHRKVNQCFLQFCIYRGNITVQTFHDIYHRPESLSKTASGFLVEASSHFTKMTKLTHFGQMSHLAEMSRFTRFVAFLLKCRDLRALSHFSWNVAIYAFCQAQNVCYQAPKTILHPC